MDSMTRSINGQAEYISFLTPLDYSPEYALAYLSSLPTGPKSQPPSDEDPKEWYRIDIKVYDILHKVLFSYSERHLLIGYCRFFR